MYFKQGLSILDEKASIVPGFMSSKGTRSVLTHDFKFVIRILS
jgi:hypothetical protein